MKHLEKVLGSFSFLSCVKTKDLRNKREIIYSFVVAQNLCCVSISKKEYRNCFIMNNILCLSLYRIDRISVSSIKPTVTLLTFLKIFWFFNTQTLLTSYEGINLI